MVKQTTFRFEARDLERVHLAVSRWCADNSITLAHERALSAARQAFKLYSEGMTVEELTDLLHQALNSRH